ncbi:hypothetical protein [Halosolutus halophilus]|uniref:hypothetical protein n=1 Tax=Halosolutus halophilus TaxID=1552990 RepID=UPI0022350412|nr:hypothetical protein [Halosolutus halophilus]
MNDAGRALVLAVLLLCSPIAATTGASVSAADGAATPIATLDADDGANETVRHQNPDEYDADGDSERIEAWLSNRLSSRLAGSTVSLSEGEYDRARNFVGEEYRDRLGQYVEVAGDTGEGGTGAGRDDRNDPEAAFEEAADEQERLIDRLEEYRTTKDEYETAVAEGDDERARELARDLEEIAADIDETSESLITNYELITFETDDDLSDAADAIDETRRDIRGEQAVVRDEQFVETKLRLDADDETVSFLEPLVARGEIRTADGSPIDGDDARFVIDGDPVAVETGANGSVAFEYRPTTQPLSAETVTVEYVPAEQSPYLGSETTLNVSVEQVEPTIANLDSTETVAYGDTLAIEGDVAAGGVPVDGVGLEVRLDGELLGEVPVTDGRIAGAVPVPAAVRDGGHTLRVALPFDDRALAGTIAETPVTVAETETDLTIDASATDENELQVAGTLETAAGDGVGDQPVEIHRDGETVATVTTDSAGEFVTTLAVPSSAASDVHVAAEYDGAETNLAPTATETTVSLSGTDRGPSSSRPTWAVLVGIVVIAAGGGLWWWRRRPAAGGAVDDADPDPVADPPGTGDRATTPELVDALLSRAREHLANGRPEAAVRASYAAVRHEYRDDAETPAARTHWEFYHRLGDDLDAEGETIEQLRAVITEYERAAFAPDRVSASAAQRVLERTRQVCATETRSSAE